MALPDRYASTLLFIAVVLLAYIVVMVVPRNAVTHRTHAFAAALALGATALAFAMMAKDWGWIR